MKTKVYQSRAERDAHVEGLLREQFGRGSATDVIAVSRRIRDALAPLAAAGVLDRLSEDQVEAEVQQAVRQLRLATRRAGA